MTCTETQTGILLATLVLAILIGYTWADQGNMSYTTVDLANETSSLLLSSTAVATVTAANNVTDSVQSLSVTPNSTTLIVGMTAETQLRVNITASHVDDLQISDGNGTHMFRLVNGTIFLNKTLTEETVYVFNITEQIHGSKVQLEVHVVSIQFEEQNYTASVEENTFPKCILDINSNAERFGVPVFYAILVNDSSFIINSSTGELCLARALDREKSQCHVLNISLRLDHQNSTGMSAVNATTYEVFAEVVVTVEDQNDLPSFGSLRPELILSVPGNVNTTYLICTFTATDQDQGLNGDIQYSIATGENSGAFSFHNGQLTVARPDELMNAYAMTITVRATDGNGTGNYTSLDVTIFIVPEEHQFKLPTPIPLPTLKDSFHDVITNLSAILGFHVFIEDMQKSHTDTDSDRSDILIRAYHHETNDTAPVRACQIGLTIAEKRAQIYVMFQRLLQQHQEQRQLKKTEEERLSVTVIALIVVSSFLLLVSVSAIICVFLVRKKKNKPKKDPWEEDSFTNMKTKNNIMNGSTIKEISSMSDIEEIIEMQEFIRTPAPHTPLTVEEQEHTFDFDFETKSLGLNTLAKREHKMDMQMQKLQLLFQALGDESVALPLNLHSEDSKHDTPASVRQDPPSGGRQDPPAGGRQDPPAGVRHDPPAGVRQDPPSSVGQTLASSEKRDPSSNVRQDPPPSVTQDPSLSISRDLPSTAKHDPSPSVMKSINYGDLQISKALYPDLHTEKSTHHSPPSVTSNKLADNPQSSHSPPPEASETKDVVTQNSNPETLKEQLQDKTISTSTLKPSTTSDLSLINEDSQSVDEEASDSSINAITHF